MVRGKGKIGCGTCERCETSDKILGMKEWRVARV